MKKIIIFIFLSSCFIHSTYAMQRLSRIPKPRISRFNKISSANFASLAMAKKIKHNRLQRNLLKFNSLILNKHNSQFAQFSTEAINTEDVYNRFAIKILSSARKIDKNFPNFEMELWLEDRIDDLKQYNSGGMDFVYLDNIIEMYDYIKTRLLMLKSYDSDVESRFYLDFVEATNQLVLTRLNECENKKLTQTIYFEEASKLAKTILEVYENNISQKQEETCVIL